MGCLIISGAFELVAKKEATRTAGMLLIPTSRIDDLDFCPWPPHADLNSTMNSTWIQFWQQTIWGGGGGNQPGSIEQAREMSKRHCPGSAVLGAAMELVM